jgi:hypothetical protein
MEETRVRLTPPDLSVEEKGIQFRLSSLGEDATKVSQHVSINPAKDLRPLVALANVASNVAIVLPSMAVSADSPLRRINPGISDIGKKLMVVLSSPVKMHDKGSHVLAVGMPIP